MNRIPRWFLVLFVLMFIMNIVQFTALFRHKIYHLLYQLQADVIEPAALMSAVNNQDIVVQRIERGGTDVVLVRFDGNGTPQETNLTAEPNFRGISQYPVWSPDGQWIAFEHREDMNNPRVLHVGDPTIYIMRADGSDKQALAEGTSPTWSPDGQTVFFTRLYTETDTYGNEQQRGDIYGYHLSEQIETLVMDKDICGCIDFEDAIIVFSNWQLSPDGTNALFQLQWNSYFPSIELWDVAVGGIKYFDLPGGGFAQGVGGIDPMWSSSGTITMGSGFSYYAAPAADSIAVPGGSPTESPDGKFMLYDGQIGDQWQIILMSTDNPAGARVVLAGEDGISYAHPSWRRV